jgi:hypothetical protein
VGCWVSNAGRKGILALAQGVVCCAACCLVLVVAACTHVGPAEGGWPHVLQY